VEGAIRVCKTVSVTRTVDVDVEVDLDDFATKELIRELRSRGEWPDTAVLIELAEEARAALRRRDLAEAIYLLDRLVDPKWGTVASVRSAYECARKVRAAA